MLCVVYKGTGSKGEFMFSFFFVGARSKFWGVSGSEDGGVVVTTVLN